MDKLIAQFSNQIKDAIGIGKSVNLKSTTTIQNVLACGLGGSGIGGKITKLLFSQELNVPFETINAYHIPNFVNEHTLVIATSYSGNTEETLAALDECERKNATIVVITSGGQLLELAKAKNWPHYVLPAGEQPRAMLAYSLVQQMFVLNGFGLINDSFVNELNKAIELIDQSETTIQTEAADLAKRIHGYTPVI